MKMRPTPLGRLTLVVMLVLSATHIMAQQGAGNGRRNRNNNGAAAGTGTGTGTAAGTGTGSGAGTGAGAGAATGAGATDDGTGTNTPGGGGLGGAITAASGALGQIAGGGASSTTNSTSTQSNSIESGTLIQVINKAFNTDSDFVDPDTNTVKYKGQTMDPTQTREFRSRFERYLALAPSPDMQAYQAVLDQVTDLLSTKNTGNVEERMRQAWTLLYEAGEYKVDGGISVGIANQIFNTWRIRDDSTAQQVAYAEQQRIKTLQQRTLRYTANTAAHEATSAASSGINNAASSLAQSGLANPAGLASATSQPSSTTSTTSTTSNSGNTNNNPTNNPGQRGGGGGGGAGTPASSSLQGTVGPGDLTFDAEALGETMAKIAAIQAGNLLTVQQGKLQMQLQIVSLFLARRYQHAMIASSFYRFIFKGDQQGLDPKFKKDLGSVFGANNPTSSSLSDMPFTIDTIELLSRQMLTEVDTGMEAVRSNFAEHQNIAALERLEETFFLGEYLPAVTQFERDKRQKLYELYKRCDEAHHLADLKDYEAVARLSTEISELTSDFRASEVTAAVRAQEQMSSLAYSGAQQAQAAGDFDRAAQYTQQAVTLWPLNPAINDGLKGYNVLSSATGRAVMVFDDAYQHQDWRRIYDHKEELMVGLMNDSRRLPQFKEVIEKMSKIEMCLAQAQEMVAQNNSFAAWEALTAAAQISPGDVQVNQRKAELAPRVAEYVGKADQAKRAEDAGDTAASLTYYLAVQDMNPASQLARLGIDRVSGQLLTSLAAEAATNNAAGNNSPLADGNDTGAAQAK